MNTIISKENLNSNTLKASNLELYMLGLLITEGQKNCTRIAEKVGVSHDMLSKVLDENINYDDYIEKIIALAEQFHEHVKIVGDETSICKPFTEKLEGCWTIIDPSNKQFSKGFTVSVLGVTIFDVFMPLCFDIFMPKAISQENYRTKSEIMQSMIKKLLPLAKKSIILLDGAYCNINMISFFEDFNVRCNMRIAANRKIVLLDGTEVNISKCPALKKVKNESSRTIVCTWKGKKVYITAHFIKNKDGSITVKYILTNYEASSKEHVATYKQRWMIEVFFRFNKQDLGLSDCRAHFLHKQLNHIGLVFKTYISTKINTLEKRLNKLKLDASLLWELKTATPISLIDALSIIF